MTNKELRDGVIDSLTDLAVEAHLHDDASVYVLLIDCVTCIEELSNDE